MVSPRDQFVPGPRGAAGAIYKAVQIRRREFFIGSDSLIDLKNDEARFRAIEVGKLDPIGGKEGPV